MTLRRQPVVDTESDALSTVQDGYREWLSSQPRSSSQDTNQQEVRMEPVDDVYRPDCPVQATGFSQLAAIRRVLWHENMFDCYRELIERLGDDASDLSVVREIARSYVTFTGG